MCTELLWLVAQVLVHREDDAPGAASVVVGTADVELSLLHVMGQVSGWYNILNTRCGAAHMMHDHMASSDSSLFSPI